MTRHVAFLAWAQRIAAETKLVNSVAHLRWNSDKTYLRDLAALGIPIVPTTWVRPGDPWSRPAEDFVIKPTVASGGLYAARYRERSLNSAERHLCRLHAAGYTAMIQPYQRSIDLTGETALVFIDGRFSHAVNKAPLLQPDVGETDRLWEHEVTTAVAPPAAHLELASAVITAVHERLGPTAYARVDLVEDQDGEPQVLEVELVEPSLFLSTATGSSQYLANALRRFAERSA